MTNSGFAAARYQKMSHVVAAAVCVSMTALQYWSSTRNAEFAQAGWESTLADQQMRIGQAPAVSARLAALAAEERQLNDELARLQKRVPISLDEQLFFEQLAADAESQGVAINEFRPSEPMPEGAHQRSTLRVSGQCNYSVLCELMLRLRKMDRLCNVDELRIQVPDVAQDLLDLQLTLSFFSTATEKVADSNESVVR